MFQRRDEKILLGSFLQDHPAILIAGAGALVGGFRD